MKNVIRKITTWMLVFGMTFTPALTSIDLVAVNAEDEGGEVTITVQDVQKVREEAETVVGTALESTNQLADDTTTAVVDEKVVTASDAVTALQQGQTALADTKSNLDNVDNLLKEINSEDLGEDGNPVGLLPKAKNSTADAVGYYNNEVKTLLQPVTDENGNPVYVQQVDENGNPVTDENGNPMYVQQRDTEGNPVVDGNGNPVYVQQTKLVAYLAGVDENGDPVVKEVSFDDINTNATNAANNAINAAKTANTSNSEPTARAAAKTAGEQLIVSENGLVNADKAVKDAQTVVNELEGKLKQAEADRDAVKAKYSALMTEIASGQTNATAANEQLKGTKKIMDALSAKVDGQYAQLANTEENLALLQKIDDASKAVDEYLSDPTHKLRDTNYWPVARQLSSALLEYYLKNNHLQIAKTVDGQTTLVSYGSDLKIGGDFKVTLVSYDVPEEPTISDVARDENGKPYIPVSEKKTDYELTPNGWTDGNVLEYQKGKAAFMDKDYPNMIHAGENGDEGNRVVVTFKDSKGNPIEFYYNYKANDDGTLYIYQKEYTKTGEYVEGDPQAVLVDEGKLQDYYKNGEVSDENNIERVELKKDDVIIDKDDDTKLFVHMGPEGEIKEYKVEDKETKPHGVEIVKIKEKDEQGREHEKEKEEIVYSIVDYNGQEIVKKTKYKFYYEVTKNIIQEFDEFTRENLTKDGMVNEISTTLISKGVKDHIDIKTGNDGKPQYFYVRSSDGTTTMYTVIVSHNGNNYSYKMDAEIYKEEKTEKKYIAENSKGYKVKDTYKAVNSDPVYAGYESFFNETGIQWDDDKVENVAQLKAIDNKQLTKDDNNKYANNFDYVAALNLKHLKEKYDKAKGDVTTAQGKTQELEDKIKKLTAQYNGIKAEGDNQVSQEPTSDLYKTLKELDQMIAGLRRNLADARHELGVAIQKRNDLEVKVEEARRAVASIDLSRFNGSGDEDEPTGGTPDTTGDTTITGGPAITTLGTPSGVAGVRTGRGTGRGTGTGTGTGTGEGTGEGTAPADNTVAKNNISTLEETELPGAAEAPSSNLQDTDLPGAQGATDNNANLWWLWTAIAVLIALGYGTYKYVDNKKKADNTIQK